MNLQVQEAKASLRTSLSVLPDMRPTWSDVDLDFDTAAEHIIRIHDADGKAKDLPVLDLTSYAITNDQGRFALQPLAGHRPARPLRSSAFSSLMGRLGAPAEFVRDRLPAPLQLAVTNYLMVHANAPKSATLRLRGNEVAAVVSERYAPLDPRELMDTVRGVLVQNGMLREVRVRAVATGVVDVLRLVFPSEEKPVKVGDVTAVGIDISTSSFSRSALHIKGLLWRLKCTNGLRVVERNGDLAFRHIGDVQRLKDGVAEAIPSSIARARGVMDLWKTAVNVMVDHVAELVEALQLTHAERKLVGEELKNETGTPELPEKATLYDFTNALTAAARQAEPARRLEMEAIAGSVLSEKARS